MHKGSCMCGEVAYEVNGPLRPVITCHCTQCRKTTGHYLAATSAERGDLTITRSEGLTWYRSSEKARRGFCKTCGSTLFWDADGEPTVSIAAGTLDGATGLAIEGHIYCADKGDYYEIEGPGYRMAQWDR